MGSEIPMHEVGAVYGQLTLIGPTDTIKAGQRLWKAQCTCGNTCMVRLKNVRSGNTKSCGCLRKWNGRKRRHPFLNGDDGHIHDEYDDILGKL